MTHDAADRALDAEALLEEAEKALGEFAALATAHKLLVSGSIADIRGFDVTMIAARSLLQRLRARKQGEQTEAKRAQ